MHFLARGEDDQEVVHALIHIAVQTTDGMKDVLHLIAVTKEAHNLIIIRKREGIIKTLIQRSHVINIIIMIEEVIPALNNK